MASKASSGFERLATDTGDSGIGNQEANDDLSNGNEPDTEATIQSLSELSVDGTAPKVLFRYIIKDDDGTITHKEESDQPIQYDASKIKITAPAKQTLLEVVTTRTLISKYGRTSTGPPRTMLKIHSPYLINALREVISYYPGLGFNGEYIEMSSPYKPLVHYWDALKSYKTNQPKHHEPDYIAITADHINTLLELLPKILENEILIELERHQRDPPVCTERYAWILFPPGTHVWIQHPNKEPRAAIIYSTGDINSSDDSTYYDPDDNQSLGVWRISYTPDMHLYATTDSLALESFEGEKEISHLNVCPGKWSKISPKIVEQQLKRGMRYTELFKPCYMEYSGQVAGTSDLQIHGKVVVDDRAWQKHSDKSRDPRHFRGYNRTPDIGDCEGQQCDCISCASNPRQPKPLPIRDWPHDPTNPTKVVKQPLPDEFYLLCNSTIGGYALEERKWVKLYLDGITNPTFEARPFDNLVLDADTKNTIEALVWNYIQEDTRVQTWSTDFVKNKGEGRIFLLHGSPGVGKTCTAECVADLIRRPLLSLTCGDMGITASEVERNFREFIDLGERWGAVVLMDEADVYLEQRTAENLQRNSLVSVFLRTLEYFRGILFLTTNRVGAFDDAFISRIHVALHYKTLTEEHRKLIWEKNFRRLDKESNITVDTATIIYAVSHPDILAVKWNGREIRNAFQTSVALAQFEARRAGRERVVLDASHLKRVVEMSKQFKDYITSTHKNQDETKRARIQETRNDEFAL